MDTKIIKNFYAILTILAAIMLGSLERYSDSYNGSLSWLFPAWVVIAVIFWASEESGAFGMITAWFLGLFIDVWEGTPLGQNALLLSSICFFIVFIHDNFRRINLVSQLSSVLMIVFLYKILSDLLSFGPIALLQFGSFLYLGTAASSVVLWLLLWFVFLRIDRRVDTGIANR